MKTNPSASWRAAGGGCSFPQGPEEMEEDWRTAGWSGQAENLRCADQVQDQGPESDRELNPDSDKAETEVPCSDPATGKY